MTGVPGTRVGRPTGSTQQSTPSRSHLEEVVRARQGQRAREEPSGKSDAHRASALPCNWDAIPLVRPHAVPRDDTNAAALTAPTCLVHAHFNYRSKHRIVF